jgi:hypothetical protein
LAKNGPTEQSFIYLKNITVITQTGPSHKLKTSKMWNAMDGVLKLKGKRNPYPAIS